MKSRARCRRRYRAYVSSIRRTSGSNTGYSRPFGQSSANSNYCLRWSRLSYGNPTRPHARLYRSSASNRRTTYATAAANYMPLGYSFLSPSGYCPSWFYRSLVRQLNLPAAGRPCFGCRY